MIDTYRLMFHNGADIYIKRDDLIPFSFGGNKVRIVERAMRDMAEKGCDAVIGYGSRTSNLNRVLAHMAAHRGIPCTIIMKEDKAPGMPMNERFVRESGASVVMCRPDSIRTGVEQEMSRLRELGRRPYYIYGSSLGTGNETVLMDAYRDAYEEICAYEEREGIHFTHIFLASGTGMTQAGLLAGSALKGDGRQITGISVARTRERGTEVIGSALRAYLSERGFDGSLPEIIFRDEYVGEGYGAGNRELSELCRHMLSAYGLPLDPIYTGKAFLGMLKEIERKGIDTPVLFLHTGGLPGVFDAAYGDMLS